MTQSSMIDRPVLNALLDQFGTADGTGSGRRAQFVNDFINMWETRSYRLMRALGKGDFDDADVVLLSIRSSGTMLGASTLEAIAGMVHAAVKRHDLPGSMAHLARLHEVGDATCRELSLVIEGE
ncbi:hypothetical protein KPL76_05755 [Subtercola sp. PAMC28395]|uniref:hypothetical protein n=1 Tax=Subtercola sp. PAMC28395 TaxID=2846775 RepID=UPI001C0E05B6|nr:hypothetical protein [Subtercola sp. PAMC28395]QWT24862.1 hypothetical protein KPL76_05755 [Subtercola sp. PAMC28395]